MKIDIITGDITTLKVDAIVNAANRELSHGGGVCGAIHQKAGPMLGKECARLSGRLGGVLAGEAFITDGYELPALYVIHTLGPVWRGGSAKEQSRLQEELADCYTNPEAGDPFTLCIMNGPLDAVLPISHIAFVYHWFPFVVGFRDNRPISTRMSGAKIGSCPVRGIGVRRTHQPVAVSGGSSTSLGVKPEPNQNTAVYLPGECSKTPVKPARASGGIGRRAGFRIPRLRSIASNDVRISRGYSNHTDRYAYMKVAQKVAQGPGGGRGSEIFAARLYRWVLAGTKFS